jgi:hypothetical protein
MEPEDPKELEPLMLSIEKMLSAIDGADQKDVAAPVASAVQSLREQFNVYTACCCRKAHVVPFAAEK